MKFIIFGLGNFGSSLALTLTEMGHEVIGIDNSMSKVDGLKDKITHTIKMDSTDPLAVGKLPFKETDIVVVAIGEDEGANIMTTALLKQYKPKRLISRAVSPLHETVLEAMEVDEIVHPEEETALRWAKKVNISGVIDSFELTGDYNIIEAKVPKRYEGKTLQEVKFRKTYNVLVLTTIIQKEEKNIIGVNKKVNEVQGVASPKTVLEPGLILVLYGNIKDIKRLLKP